MGQSNTSPPQPYQKNAIVTEKNDKQKENSRKKKTPKLMKIKKISEKKK